MMTKSVRKRLLNIKNSIDSSVDPSLTEDSTVRELLDGIDHAIQNSGGGGGGDICCDEIESNLNTLGDTMDEIIEIITSTDDSDITNSKK